VALDVSVEGYSLAVSSPVAARLAVMTEDTDGTLDLVAVWAARPGVPRTIAIPRHVARVGALRLPARSRARTLAPVLEMAEELVLLLIRPLAVPASFLCGRCRSGG
jgi:hypothetical protein